MDDILKDFVIPIATFMLGVLFTMLWDKRKKKQEDFNKAANWLSGLTNDWYNQLYMLNSEKKFNSKNYQKELFFYSQNRLVLPEYLKIITYLEENKKYSILVDKAKSFLELVTDYENKSHKDGLKCTFCFMSPTENTKTKGNTLSKLDSLLQEIAVETGNSLKE